MRGAEIWQDSRYALRWFRRDSGLTAAVVLTLAFGVGLNAGVFSILSGMVFRSRVETDSASFIQVLAGGEAGAPHLFATSTAEFNTYRSAPGIRQLAGWTVTSGRVDDDADLTLLMLTSCGFFKLYGLEQPLQGRLFTGAECESAGAAPVALIGEQVWRGRYRGSAGMVGRKIEVDRRAYTVVGILPANFAGRLRGPGIWIPYSKQRPFYGGVDLFARDTQPWLTVEGRLVPGISRREAERELRALTPGRPLVLTNGSIFEDPSSRTAAGAVTVLLSGALGLVLLLACANVASLLLARAVSRRYEMSVRLSMGASPGRLLRMAATEGLLMAALSGGVSVGIAAALPATFQRLVPQMPHYPVHTDWVVFAYLAGITLASGCAASLVPAMESLRKNLSGSLKREESGAGRGVKLREALVALQAGVSLVLMIGAALFARTENRMVTFSQGFDAARVMMAPVTRSEGAPPFAQAQRSLSAVSGVRSAAFASSLFWSRSEETALRLPGGGTVRAQMTAVSPEFFSTLGIGMSRGYGFDGATPNQAVLTEAAARRLFAGKEAVGQTLESEDGAKFLVTGVVQTSDLDERSPVPRVFRAMDPNALRAVALARFRGDAETAARGADKALHDAGLTAREAPRTIAAEMGALGSRFSVMAGFATFFGASAFVLALIGLYGVISFLVGRRTKEMGIRLALGASRADVVREVLRSGLKPVAWGVAAGLPVAGLLAVGIGFAFRSTPAPFHAGDPLAFLATPLLLAAGATAAILRPALRASAADPAASLRHD